MSQAVEVLREQSRTFGTKARETQNRDLKYWFAVASEQLYQAARWLAQAEASRTPDPAAPDAMAAFNAWWLTDHPVGAQPAFLAGFEVGRARAPDPARLLEAAKDVRFLVFPMNRVHQALLNEFDAAIAEFEAAGKGGA